MDAKDTLFSQNNTLNIQGKCISRETPLIQGIVNITSDSFYDGGKYDENDSALSQIDRLIQQGANIIDIGGQSTRPGAIRLSPKEEIKRVIPIIKQTITKHPETIISIDTFYSEVAKASVSEGVSIVNDVFGGREDKNMFTEVSKLNVPYVLTHSKGNSSNMQEQTQYEDIIHDMIDYFITKINELNSLGVNDIIIDPGFGFAKTFNQNYEVLKKLEFFKILGRPILVGISRKSMIYNLLKKTPQEVMNGTTVLNTFALMKGASILRVHDVIETKEAITLMNKINIA